MSWVNDYCILEIITTGPDPQTALPVEVAAVRVRDGVEIDSLAACVDPGVPVPASLLERSGRGDGEYRGGLTPDDALARIRDFIKGRPVLSHEGSVMEAALLERFHIGLAGPLLDTRELAWLVAPYLRDHSLPSLAVSLLGEPPSWKALEDARLLLRILARLEEAWEEAPGRTREAVLGALHQVDSPWRFFLKGRRGRHPFPDLADMVPRLDTARPAAARPAGEATPSPGARAPGERGAVDPDEVASVLAPGGALASVYPDHEARPQQAAMARAVASAMGDSAFLVVEAGTGVGKSLAYLVPGVLYARAGKGPLVVSTYTRNLQEQLFHRDLPLLSRSLGSIEFSLLKGRSNYLCLRKWSEWCDSLSEGDPAFHFGEVPPAAAYAFLASWASRSASGDLEEISLDLRGLLPELLPELSSSPEDCLRPHCRFHTRCWVEKARSRAARSEVVVINHALLLSQIYASENGPSNLILPDYRLLVADEAHHLEDVATEALTLDFSREDCLKTLEDISGRRGLLTRWSLLPLDASGQRMIDDAHRETEEARDAVEHWFDRVLDPLLPPVSTGAARGEEAARYRLNHATLAGPAWEHARDKGLELAARLYRISALLVGLVEKTLSLPAAGDQEELKVDARRGETLAGRASEAAAALEVFMREPGDENFHAHLRWVERSPKRGRGLSPPTSGVKSAPVGVGEELASLLFSRLDCAVLTSASLRVPGAREGFRFFLHRTGLDLVEEYGREVRLVALDSPFDYSSQVRLIAVTDLPEPSSGKPGFKRYMKEISRVVEEALAATGGKALVLLTSHQQVDFLYSELRPRLEQQGLCCLRQRKGTPNALLLERFRMDRDSVLMATEAFWEGVDVPGESLSAVIVVKLPFRHPEDPVVAGRMEYQDAAGGGGWGSYYMPLAVTLFRQGIGRLVRRSTDQGIIVVLDPRFLTRSYSRHFHAMLPAGLRVEAVTAAELASAIRRSFPRNAGPEAPA